jgi:predicted nucleotidyltransferase
MSEEKKQLFDYLNDRQAKHLQRLYELRVARRTQKEVIEAASAILGEINEDIKEETRKVNAAGHT